MRKPVPVVAASLALGLAVAFGVSTAAHADTKPNCTATPSSSPCHPVIVASFEIGTCEVTIGS